MMRFQFIALAAITVTATAAAAAAAASDTNQQLRRGHQAAASSLPSAVTNRDEQPPSRRNRNLSTSTSTSTVTYPSSIPYSTQLSNPERGFYTYTIDIQILRATAVGCQPMSTHSFQIVNQQMMAMVNQSYYEWYIWTRL